MGKLTSVLTAIAAVMGLATANAAQASDRGPIASAEDVSTKFEKIVEAAMSDCREALRNDVFANLRMEICVETKVADALSAMDEPAVAEFADAHPDFFIIASSR